MYYLSIYYLLFIYNFVDVQFFFYQGGTISVTAK